MIDAIADLLACPVCRNPLALAGGTLACPRNHTFDVSRAGYVDLVAPVGRRAPDADSSPMVQAREDFLAAGHYHPISAALSAELSESSQQHTVEAFADLGAGPGHYARHLLAALPAARAVAVDLSRAAVSRAAHSDPRMGAVRANVKTFVPLRDASVDALTVVFAPRNPEEWWRILTPVGRVLVVIPTEAHLRQLREIGAVLEIEPGKRERLISEVEPRFEVERSTTVEWDCHPEPNDVATLIGMGPSALHGSRLRRVAEDAATTITASVEIHVLAPRAGERPPRPR